MHLDGSPTIYVAMRPRRLGWRIVGHLALEYDDAAVGTVPDDLVLLVVLDEQAICRHVIAVDDDPDISGVDSPPNPASVVGSPSPDVVEDDVVAVDDQAG